MYKKTILAILGILLGGMTEAGVMGPVCVSSSVDIPCGDYWELGIQGLVLRSTFNADKAYLPLFATPNSFEEIANNWNYGFKLEGAYKFNQGHDITLTWMNYKGRARREDLGGATPIEPVQVFDFNLISENKFDQVNLVMGQFFDISNESKLRLYGGLQYAHIQINGTNFFQGIPLEEPLTAITQFDNSDYKGLGPVAGVDYWYNLCSRWSLTASSTASILAGKNRYSNGYIFEPLGLIPVSAYAFQKTIVPSLEGKIGINYAYNIFCGNLNFDLGFEALNYFNAIQTQGQAGIFSGRIQNSDYGLYGPYFGIKYSGFDG